MYHQKNVSIIITNIKQEFISPETFNHSAANQQKCSYVIIQTEITAISIIKKKFRMWKLVSFQGAFFVVICSADKPRVQSEFQIIN